MSDYHIMIFAICYLGVTYADIDMLLHKEEVNKAQFRIKIDFFSVKCKKLKIVFFFQFCL